MYQRISCSKCWVKRVMLKREVALKRNAMATSPPRLGGDAIRAAGAHHLLWRAMWPMLCWAPVPEDEQVLTMRWWPYWCQHLQVIQVPRFPALAWWCPAQLGPSTLRRVYANARDVESPARLYKVPRGGACGKTFRLWCRGQLIGVLLPGRRLVLGAVQNILHTHVRRGWVRHIRLQGWGDVLFERSRDPRFRWLNGKKEECVVVARSLERPRKVRGAAAGVRSAGCSEYDA